MKIGQKLILGFVSVASLVGVVGYVGLGASKQITQSYGGLSEEFQKDVDAAIEVQSLAKRTESDLMLYLTLDSEIDKEKFFASHKRLEEQISILERVVTISGDIEQVTKLKSASDDILRIGVQLIEAHDSAPEVFEPKDYAELVKGLNDVASAARKAGVEIARKRIVDAGVEASSFAKRAESHLMLYLTLDSQTDKEKFFARHKSLEQQIAILDVVVKSQQLTKLKSASDDILRIGVQLIEAHDSAPEVFEPKDYAELVKGLNDAASAAGKTGVEIAKLEALATKSNVEEARKNAAVLQSEILTLMIITVVIALGVGIFISRSISKPITKLKDRAIEIGEGKLDAKIEIKSRDEIGQLANSFNKMSESLATSIDNLSREITKRKLAEDAMEGLNKELESTVKKLSRSNQELQDFVHITAHDLKSPLRAIGILADWISTDYSDKFDKQGQEQVKLLVGRAERMSKLIDSILQYSKVGGVKEKQVQVNLNELVPEVIDMAAPPENIAITVENELPVIECEETRITQVFQNLLSNAIKYMDKPKGQIRIGCVEEDGFWKFSVTDNGPGIKEEYFEKIFKIFQTLLPRDEFESTGVGLTMAKKIIEMYGGKIWVESKPGEGSTFFFTLPKQEMGVKDAKYEANIVSRR